MKKHKIALVEWEDAQTNHFPYSLSPEEILEDKNIEKCITLTLGFVINNNKERIIISDSMFDGRCKDTRTIPKGMVKNIIFLKDARRDEG